MTLKRVACFEIASGLFRPVSQIASQQPLRACQRAVADLNPAIALLRWLGKERAARAFTERLFPQLPARRRFRRNDGRGRRRSQERRPLIAPVHMAGSLAASANPAQLRRR
jgi:hypothetical protein